MCIVQYIKAERWTKRKQKGSVVRHLACMVFSLTRHPVLITPQRKISKKDGKGGSRTNKAKALEIHIKDELSKRSHPQAACASKRPYNHAGLLHTYSPPPRDDGLFLFTKSVSRVTGYMQTWKLSCSEEKWTLSGKLDTSRGPVEGLRHGHMNSTGGTGLFLPKPFLNTLKERKAKLWRVIQSQNGCK